MKAAFRTTMKVAEAHAELAGLTMSSAKIAKGENLHAYQLNDTIFVAGDKHAVMRLIGAFADDGMDVLIEAGAYRP